MLHHRIEAFQGTFVAVIHERAPGGLDRETAPVGAAARLVGIGRGMGQAAVRALRIGPGLEPVQVQRGDLGHRLQRLRGCIAVPAVAQALDAGAIDHIAAEGEVLHGRLHQAVDGVEVRIRALEAAVPGQGVADPAGPDVLRGLRKPFQEHIPHQMMVEPVGETVIGRAGSHIDILALRGGLEGSVGVQEVAESGCDSRPGRQPGQRQVQHRVYDAAEIHQDGSIVPFFDGNGLQRLLELDRTAHHRGGNDPFRGDEINRSPRGFHAGLDPFPAEAVRLPGAQVFPASPGALPGIVGPKDRHAIHVQFRLHQRTVVGHAEGLGLIPARAGIDQELVLPFPQVQAVSDDKRALVQLGNGRKQHGVRDLFPIDIHLVIAEGRHVQDGLTAFLRLEHLPEHRLASLPGDSADEIALETVQDADSEVLLRAPGGNISGRVPHADTPPSLLPGIEWQPFVRNHHLVRGFHLSGLPEVRAHLDLVGGLFHRLVRTDLPAEVRLGAVDAQRLREALAAKVINPERRLAGRQGQEADNGGDDSLDHRRTMWLAHVWLFYKKTHSQPKDKAWKGDGQRNSECRPLDSR